jgi:hypothetical protein
MRCLKALSITAILLAAGCNSGPRLVRLFGEVSYQGKPIEKGTIEFVPAEGTPGPSTGGAIKGGHYDVAVARGPREGGVYQVRITALKKTGQTVPNLRDASGRPVELEDNFIPAKYNLNSTLKVTVTTEAARKGIDFQLQ